MKFEFFDEFQHAIPCLSIDQPTKVATFAGKRVLQVALALNFSLYRVVDPVAFVRLRQSTFTTLWGKSASPAGMQPSAAAAEIINGFAALPPAAPAHQMDPWFNIEAALFVAGRPGRNFYVWQDWSRLCSIDTTIPYSDPLFGPDRKCSFISASISHGAIVSRGRVFTIGHGALGLMERLDQNVSMPNAPQHFVNEGEAYRTVSKEVQEEAAGSWFSETVNEVVHNEQVRQGGWPGGMPFQEGIGLSQVAFHPMLCTTLQLENIEQVACGTYHTVARSRGGRLFAFGVNLDGQLATGTFVGIRCPDVSSACAPIAEHRAVSCAAGGFSSAFLAVRGTAIFESSDRRRAKQVALHWWSKVQARGNKKSMPQRRLSMFVREELQGLSIEELSNETGGLKSEQAAAESEQPAKAPKNRRFSVKNSAVQRSIQSQVAANATGALDAMVGRMLHEGGLSVATKPETPWTEHTTDEGYVYYYNASTGVSAWEKPVDMP
jgi:hypothetical protein